MPQYHLHKNANSRYVSPSNLSGFAFLSPLPTNTFLYDEAKFHTDLFRKQTCGYKIFSYQLLSDHVFIHPISSLGLLAFLNVGTDSRCSYFHPFHPMPKSPLGAKQMGSQVNSALRQNRSAYFGSCANWAIKIYGANLPIVLD